MMGPIASPRFRLRSYVLEPDPCNRGSLRGQKSITEDLAISRFQRWALSTNIVLKNWLHRRRSKGSAPNLTRAAAPSSSLTTSRSIHWSTALGSCFWGILMSNVRRWCNRSDFGTFRRKFPDMRKCARSGRNRSSSHVSLFSNRSLN